MRGNRQYSECQIRRYSGAGSLFKKADAAVGAGEANGKGEAASGGAFQNDFAAVSAHDSANDQEFEARARRLRREVRFETAANVFGRYAAAGV